MTGPDLPNQGRGICELEGGVGKVGEAGGGGGKKSGQNAVRTRGQTKKRKKGENELGWLEGTVAVAVDEAVGWERERERRWRGASGGCWRKRGILEGGLSFYAT